MLASNFTLYLINHIILIFFTLLIIITFRGFSKATVANFLGDKTAKFDGFLTLNPLIHINFIPLSFMLLIYFIVSQIFLEVNPIDMPILIIVTFCSRIINQVPINEHNFKYPRFYGGISVGSGVISSFILASLSLLILKFILLTKIYSSITISLFSILKAITSAAISWGILDTLPIPPLSGGQILYYVLPKSAQKHLDWLENYSFIILFILFFVPFINQIFLGTIWHLKIYIQSLLIKSILL